MRKIGIKIVNPLNYEQFESFQYLLEYDFEYEDIESYIEEKKIIELDIDEDDVEDRAEDIEALQALLFAFDSDKIEYQLYIFEELWEERKINQIE